MKLMHGILILFCLFVFVNTAPRQAGDESANNLAETLLDKIFAARHEREFLSLDNKDAEIVNRVKTILSSEESRNKLGITDYSKSGLKEFLPGETRSGENKLTKTEEESLKGYLVEINRRKATVPDQKEKHKYKLLEQKLQDITKEIVQNNNNRKFLEDEKQYDTVAVLHEGDNVIIAANVKTRQIGQDNTLNNLEFGLGEKDLKIIRDTIREQGGELSKKTLHVVERAAPYRSQQDNAAPHAEMKIQQYLNQMKMNKQNKILDSQTKQELQISKSACEKCQKVLNNSKSYSYPSEHGLEFHKIKNFQSPGKIGQIFNLVTLYGSGAPGGSRKAAVFGSQFLHKDFRNFRKQAKSRRSRSNG